MAAITDVDEFLLAQGTHRKAYEKLGAHPETCDGAAGVRFAVWAPNADEVSVIGDFNRWRAGENVLHSRGNSGIWEGFHDDVNLGDAYKYAIRPRGSTTRLEKADPYAFGAEMRPRTASRVTDLTGFRWTDEAWLERRQMEDWVAKPISIYEVHLGSWRQDPVRPDRFLTYRELAAQLPQYVSDLGFTHIELMPVAEHPLDMSWGYQTTGYFAPTARFGPPQDFMYFVDCCHAAGLGVILDWVPAHFPKDAHGLARFDGSPLYEHADPRQGEHQDWGTLIFNYGRHEVRSFLISNALFWIDRYHVDGLRVDAVASMLYLDYSRRPGEWIPNRYGGRENLEAIDMLRGLNSAVHENFPGVLMTAEESTAWPNVTGAPESGGLGFDLKWNMGWMHDTLAYMSEDPVHRKYHHNELTFSLVYAFTEKFLLPLSHDEVTHGKRSMLDKMPGDVWQQFANLRLLYGYMFGHPGKKLLFMGGEFGQWKEWDHAHSLDWHLTDQSDHNAAAHIGLRALIADLNGLYRSQAALYELDSDPRGFEWVDYFDADNSVIVFRRRALETEADGESKAPDLVFACNFTPVVREGYRIGLPEGGRYAEILNTDAAVYGGSGIANQRDIFTDEVPWHGQPVSAEVTLPPLAVIVLSTAR